MNKEQFKTSVIEQFRRGSDIFALMFCPPMKRSPQNGIYSEQAGYHVKEFGLDVRIGRIIDEDGYVNFQLFFRTLKMTRIKDGLCIMILMNLSER